MICYHHQAYLGRALWLGISPDSWNSQRAGIQKTFIESSRKLGSCALDTKKGSKEGFLLVLEQGSLEDSLLNPPTKFTTEEKRIIHV